ncbi:MAG: hypothetical protein M3115_03865 [Thermoproteota archaeon]|nr:hypothetical protein [Thermoproteota archaeon]
MAAALLMIILLTNIPSESSQGQSLGSLLQSSEEEISDNVALFSLGAFEYTFDIDGNQIFPNDTIKNRIVAEYQPSVYNIPSLQYNIMEHTINASNIEIHVNPTRIDETSTRLDFQIYANNAEVTGQLLSKNYADLTITSAYGIYDRISDKMTIHIPYSVALQHLMK